MTGARHELTSYVFDVSSTYFVDTNVLVSCLRPGSPGGSSRACLLGWDQTLASQRCGHSHLMLWSSRVRRRMGRFEFRRLRALDFKTFRKSAAFKSVAQDIVIALKGYPLAREAGGHCIREHQSSSVACGV